MRHALTDREWHFIEPVLPNNTRDVPRAAWLREEAQKTASKDIDLALGRKRELD